MMDQELSQLELQLAESESKLRDANNDGDIDRAVEYAALVQNLRKRIRTIRGAGRPGDT